MKVAAAVLTWQQYKTDRHELFKDTVRSLSDVDDLFLVDNGSTDGTAEYVTRLGGYVNTAEITTCGYGMNLAAAICAKSDADIVVLSNDDIIWQPDAMSKLRDLWPEIPDDVKIVSGLLEATYPWNTPRERLDTSVTPVLIRETVSGAAWTFRRSDYETIFPVPTKHGWDDVPTCRRLTGMGFRVGAADLVAHVGGDKSSWGNASFLYQKQSVEGVKAEWGM